MPTFDIIKRQNSDTIFNIRPIGRHSHKCFSPNIFTFKRIWKVRFVYECYRSIIEKTIVIWGWEMPEKMFLRTCLRALKFSAVIFAVFPTMSKGINSLSNILFQTFFGGIELANDKSIIYYKKEKRSLCDIFICILNFKREKSKFIFAVLFIYFLVIF